MELQVAQTTRRHYLKPPQAAEYLGLAVSTLAKMRLRGDGAKFIKIGKKCIVYDIVDLDAWMDSQKRNSTSDIGK